MDIEKTKMLSIGEVAKMFNITYYAAQTMFHSKGFPRIQIGRRLYVRLTALEKFLDKKEKAG